MTLPEAPFDLVICMNVLEHLYRPITAMDNMCGLLKEGGYILISVPLIVIPQRFRKGFFDFFLKVLGKKIVPGLYECWPHISLYVICRKLP